MSGRGRGRGGGRTGSKSASQQFLQSSAKETGVGLRDISTTGAGETTVIFPDLELHSSGERGLHPHESDNLKISNGGDGGGGATTETAANDGVDLEASGDGKQAMKKEEGEIGNPDAPPPAQPDGGTSTTSTPTPAVVERPKSPRTIYLISKSREMHHKFQSSAFYIRSKKEGVPDVVRYSDKLRRSPPNIDGPSAVLSHCLGGRKRTRGEGGGVFVPEELCGGQRRIKPTDAGGDGTERDSKKNPKGLNLEDLAAKIKSEDGMVDDEDEQKQQGGEEEDEDFVREEEEEESDHDADYAINYYESDGDESRGSDGEPTF